MSESMLDCCCTRRDSGYGRSASGEFMLGEHVQDGGILKLGPYQIEQLTAGTRADKVMELFIITKVALCRCIWLLARKTGAYGPLRCYVQLEDAVHSTRATPPLLTGP